MEAELVGQMLSIAEVKEGLPCAYVLMRSGAEGNDGHYLCPWHADQNPSLDLYGDNRWTCSPCGLGGDVLDLLGAFAPALTFGDRMTWAVELMADMVRDGWGGQGLPRERVPFDIGEGSALVAASCQKPHLGLSVFVDVKSLPFSGRWLWSDWGCGVSGSRIVIPYWSGTGELRTYRTRAADGSDKPKSAPGRVTVPTFYGEWRDKGRPAVVICEGESDTWTAAWSVGKEMDVLGVMGAGVPAFGIDRLQNRTVILAFDGDQAGRAAAERWRGYLWMAGQLPCRTLELADGRDLSSYSVSEVRNLLLVDL